MKLVIALLVSVGIMGGGAGVWYYTHGGQDPVQFRTTPVERGNLLATVVATGTLKPEEEIDVGARVAGQILRFGRDPKDATKPIDFCSEVEEGTVLAQLDDSLYVSQVGQARADVLRAEADLVQLRAKQNHAERDWNRVRRLSGASRGVVSDLEYDTALSLHETARAAVTVGEAALTQAQEALKQTETNLSYTTIRSPVRGVIVERRVNVGQTVVASLNSPSLFLIATDLTKLNIWASVNEADIGSIHLGQPVRFTVDAFPDQTFQGKVSQIRLNATMTMSVVTYTVLVSTDNADRKLPPYQTANLQFQVNERTNVLMVPNGALRWRPQLSLVSPDHREEYTRALKRRSGNLADPRTAAAEKERQTTHFLWVKDGTDFVRPVKVRMGLSDGSMTEIIGDELNEGDQIVIGAALPARQDNTVSPLAPQLSKGKGK